MLDTVLLYLVGQPGRLRGLGHCLMALGAGLLLLGWLGDMAVDIAANTARPGSAGASCAPRCRLAHTHPKVPTWFVPESLWGFGLAVLLLLAGGVITLLGRRFDRSLM